MCGGSMTEKRQPPIREIEYLDALVRGVYAKRDLPAGHQLAEGDVFLAVPLLKGQLSCRELIAGEELIRDVSAKAPITIEGSGPKSTFRIEGIGEGRGDTFTNPVTGEEHLAEVHLPTGFIWTRGQCGVGTFSVSAAGVSVASEKSNWILYDFDWSNA